jgi:hypothetical protein
MARTDSDTWDLATSVGATATMVAAARAVATNADNPLINDRFAEPLVRAVGVDFLTRWATGELSAADVDDSDGGWRLAHMPDAMALRTRYFDAFFGGAAAAGIRQAVILASGLDARAYRLTWPDMSPSDTDKARERMRKAAAKWRDHGFDLESPTWATRASATTSQPTSRASAGARSERRCGA